MNKYTKALVLGIGSLFLCLNSNAGIKRANRHFTSGGCPVITVTTIKQVNVTCNGGNNGMAVVSVSGGAAPYTYTWTPSGGTKDTASNLTAGTYTCTVKDKNGCTGTRKVVITQPVPLGASISSLTNVKCFGAKTGSAKVSVVGGGPYTYSWAPSGGTNIIANNLGAGTYTCTVTGCNGSTATAVATITQPATAVTATISVTEVTCSGGTNGTATDNPSGGSSPYTYKWITPVSTAKTITNLTAGAYGCTVTDANGCAYPASATITQPAAYNFTKSTTTPTCNKSNGKASAAVTGNTPPYIYSWSPVGGTKDSAINLSAGSYTLTVSDANGCASSTTYIISNTGMGASTSVTNILPCSYSDNGTASATIAGGTSPYTYSWTTGATTTSIGPLSASTYTVTITDKNGCIGVARATITEPTQLRDSIATQTNVKCNGSSTGSAKVGVKGGLAPYTYSWAPSGGTNATASSLSAGSYTVTVKDKNGCIVTATATITQPATALSAPITSSTSPTCNGDNNGSITVTASGGVSPYTYAWTPSGGTKATASNLTGATYTCTVTDKNMCTATPSITLVNPALLTASITSHTNATCGGGGSATVTAGGGTTPYSYNWSPAGGTNSTASGLVGGNYTVTVTDKNGCTATASITITSSSSLSVSVTASTNPTCSGSSDGSATATVTGGASPFTYSWTPSGGTNAVASGLSVGTYTINVTDNAGCLAIASVTLSTPALTATISASANPLCNGNSNGSATVTAGGGTSPYTYSWSPSGITTAAASGLSAGSYTVTVTDNHSCTNTASITLTDPVVLNASITSSTNPLCNGDFNGSAVVVASGGTGLTYTYSWALSGGTGDTATGLNAGTYTVTVTDSNSCTATANVTLTNPAVLTANITSNSNPLCNGSSDGSATVSVAGGTSPYSYSWTSGGTTATASGLSAGGYTVTVTDKNGCSASANVTLSNPTSVTASISGSSNPLCNGGSTGSATVTAGGGTGTYTYSWAPSGGTNATANGLSAGSYTVTVTDGNSCSATANVTLIDPAVLSASISGSTNILCNGSSTGAASVTASGGTSPYNYSWAPAGGTAATASGLSAGNYTVTVTDANSCSTTATVSITEPSPIVDTKTTIKNASCSKNNGSVSITISGGVPSYTYSWAPSGGTNSTANSLSAATYTCTVTDANSCTLSVVAIVKDSSTLAASMASHKNDLCYGSCNGKAFGMATGGTAPYTYSWSPVSSTSDSATGLCAGLYNFTVTDNVGCTASDTVRITQPGRIVVTPATTNASCNGNCDGSISAGVTGGTPGYVYLWNNGQTTSSATGLCAAAYSVTVTDANGCIGDTSATVTQPATLRDSVISVVNVTCNGGNNGCASIGVKYGTSPYTYAWSNGMTTSSSCGLTAGTYTITVTDANGCTIIDSAKIMQPTAITGTASSTPATCGGNNGSATASASGGTGTLTYSWLPSGGTGANTATYTNLVAGSYTCTVTDANGCTTTLTTNVSNTGGPTVTSSGTDVSCNGGSNGSAMVNASGGTSPYTYSWSPGGGTNPSISGLSAATYTCTVTDFNGCKTIDTVKVTQPAPLAVTIDSIINSSCIDTIWAVPSGGTTPYTYSWNTGATTVALDGICGGNYTVTVTDANGCTSMATIYIVPTAIQELNNVSDVKVYPVPTSGDLNISISDQSLMPQQIMVYDITGRKVMEQKVDKTATLIHMDVSALSNGTYLLEITGVNSKTMARFTVGK